MEDIKSILGAEEFNPEDMVKIKKQLQDINDTIQGGLRSANLKEYRNTYVINAQDSLDVSYPMYVHFSIIPEMVKIVSINVAFWFLNFRAYSTAASSGGAVTSASGGSQTPTSSSVSTPSGGSSTPTSAEGGSQTPTSSSVSTPSGGGSTSGATGTASGGGSTSGANGRGHSHLITIYDSDTLALAVTYNPTENRFYCDMDLVGDPGFDIYTSGAETQDHTHTTPDHTHPNHTHSTPDHIHPAHTHTVGIAAHQHTVSIAAHTHTEHAHTVSVAAHTHTGGAHTHGITYGIFEDSTSPTVMLYVSRDNGLTYSLPTGSYTADHENIDITSLINSAGSKMLKFTTNARTRLSVQITIKLDISAR